MLMKKSMNCTIAYYSDVEAEAVDWLWFPYIPYGKITIVQGDPGEGKTSFALHLAVLLSRGLLLPDGRIAEPINIIYQNGEDSVADTIKPRLERMNADCSRIAFIPDGVTLDDACLEEAIQQTATRLLILDPLQAFIPKNHNLGRVGDMRNVMGHLASVAEKTNCAVLIVGHMEKTTSAKGIYRGIGSIDIAAIARGILLIGRPTEDSDLRTACIRVLSNLDGYSHRIFRLIRILKNSMRCFYIHCGGSWLSRIMTKTRCCFSQ